jgi:hypothetical protein
VHFYFLFSSGSSLHLCNRQSLNEASSGSFATPARSKKPQVKPRNTRW